ncbi:ATP synthase subunit s, mitochondrial-like isoform X1 [Pollicipes pollicipes]|uniref:ATP synthase subunit s, mitochondrial-like isoform X1 n=2 Tax=Pollicipes pollicipes TaxID=41117 RepID=UPI0018851512|nr:ATP synthase subunit s, mitochondrial-like isoform X1 [Pollicipes pollicipes]
MACFQKMLLEQMLRSALSIARSQARCLRACTAPIVLLCPSRLMPGGAPQFQQPQRRNIWGWLNAIFNKVDASRIDSVGPDRACAEWLLRCGAHFRWRSQPGWQTDYNSLPPGGSKKNYIEEINADNAAIMHIGFHHFRGLSSLRRIRFHYCGYLDDTGLRYLEYLSHSLESLEISSCGNVTMDGLRHLAKLKALKELRLFDLPEVEDRAACVRELKQLLPGCRISFPPPHQDERTK